MDKIFVRINSISFLEGEGVKLGLGMLFVCYLSYPHLNLDLLKQIIVINI